MDGVLVHEEDPIPGATEFVEALKASGKKFLVLTNNSIFTPRDLRARLLGSGIDVPEEAIWTSALATADFLADQRPHGTAYVVGEAGLTTAMHDIGYVMTDRDPDYVVLGETRTYSFEAITRAIRLIDAGARFIATNPDASGPSAAGKLPACGSVAALISTATGRQPYFVGKPNPLMMRSALNRLEAHSETTVMIGDRMDTDIISGLEAGLRTVLVTTGSTPSRTRSRRFPTARPGSSTRSPTSSSSPASPAARCEAVRPRPQTEEPSAIFARSWAGDEAKYGVTAASRAASPWLADRLDGITSRHSFCRSEVVRITTGLNSRAKAAVSMYPRAVVTRLGASSQSGGE